MEKDFAGWSTQKERIHNSGQRPYYHEREIWWCALGANVGFEEDGKHVGFERPVVVFKKFNNQIFWALPVTTQVKEGKYYFTYSYHERPFAIILSQIRLLDAKRLKRKICTLPKYDFREMLEKFEKLK